jgi:hypothetical protein
LKFVGRAARHTGDLAVAQRAMQLAIDHRMRAPSIYGYALAAAHDVKEFHTVIEWWDQIISRGLFPISEPAQSAILESLIETKQFVYPPSFMLLAHSLTVFLGFFFFLVFLKQDLIGSFLSLIALSLALLQYQMLNLVEDSARSARVSQWQNARIKFCKFLVAQNLIRPLRRHADLI